MKKTIRLVKMAAVPVAAALLTAAFLVVFPISPALAHPSTFPDVTETNPAHDAIESLVSRGILSGDADGNFQPNAALARGQAAKILVNWRGIQPANDPTAATPAPFTDVNPMYQAYVATAYTKGWVGGYPDGTFHPSAFLTREQMAVITLRSLGLDKEIRALSNAQVISIVGPFSDRGLISDAALPYVAFAVSEGLLGGDYGALRPLDPVTRAQFALVLSRADGLEVALSSGIKTLEPAGPVAPGSRVTDPTGPGTDSAGDPALSPDERKLADFIDRFLLQPHRSPITGEMVLQNVHKYGIPAFAQLVIMTAETSLGDPQLGGTLARRNNFGCMRYHGADTPWGLLSDGRIWVAGKDWYSFPTPQAGMAAFGRYLKLGVNGYYVPILTAVNPDWEGFASVYYGRGVAGFGTYVNNLSAIGKRYRAMAAQQGVSL